MKPSRRSAAHRDAVGCNQKAEGSAGQRTPEPRWPVVLALLALGGLQAALPPSLLAGGSRWLLLGSVSVLLVPAIIMHRSGHHLFSEVLGYVLSGVVTVAMVWSLALLIQALPTHRETPPQLLWSAAALWVSNILVFASWYWRLDAGGPHQRALAAGHTDGAFLFPQERKGTRANRRGFRAAPDGAPSLP